MRRLVSLLAAVVFVTAGCMGDDSDSSSDQESANPPAATAPVEEPPAPTQQPARLYKKAELPRLALQPSDAPRGMRYTKAESGRKTLEDVGLIFDTQTAQLRRLGFRGLYDAVFDSTKSDLRLALRLWLFRQASGASGWLEQTRGNSELLLQPFSIPPLADGSWAARGNLNGSDVITHAFRAGNLVVVMTFSTQSERLSAPTALAAAQKAVAHVGQV